MELATESVAEAPALERARWAPAVWWVRKYRGGVAVGDLMAGLTLRNRQVKNLLTVTMLSIGLPMILMGG